MNITAGKVLQNGKYVLDGAIGQGGFGITYKATHTYLGQTVVIKILNEELRREGYFERFQQQFIAEAQRLAKCQHPNIVRVLDFFEEDGQSFIVMDYIPGPTLAESVKPGQPLQEPIAIHYIRQIGSALSLVHQNGLLHRDVKPQNIIRREGTQTVILIDFGIAREFTPGVTQTHTGILSAGYAPIEQYLPQARRSPATDIYALAATLYYLLTGQPPVAAALRDRVPLPNPRQINPNLSPNVELAILQGMEMEAAKRPQTVEAWLALLPDPQHYDIPTTNIPESQIPNPPTAAKTPTHSPAHPILQKPGLKVIGITASVAALVGIGLGLALRFGGNGLIQREQSFPPTKNWPTVEPTVEPPSTPSPSTQTNLQTESPKNYSPPPPQPTAQAVVQEPTPTQKRSKYRQKVRKVQQPVLPVLKEPIPEPTPTIEPITTKAAEVSDNTEKSDSSPTPADSPTPTPISTPAALATPEPQSEAAPTPAEEQTSSSTSTNEPSNSAPPVVQPMPPIPATDPVSPSSEPSPTP